jgi:predicted dehydrogenase
MDTRNEQTRREFLRTASLLAGSSVFVTALPWLPAYAAKKKNIVSPSDKVKLGLIGIGSRGSLLFLHLKEIPAVEIVAVCDNYPPHLERAVQMSENKAKGFEDYRKLLEMKEIDGVIIATPLYTHAEITIDSLLAGKHTFCEKAMAKTPEDCLRMFKAQQVADKVLLIGYQRMFNIKYLKAFELIKAGQLGNITQIRAYWHRNNDWRRPVPSPELEKKINWRLYREFSSGLMTELASHQIEVANVILEQFPDSVMGNGSINYWHDGREVYDNVNLIYTYPNGTQLIYDSMTSNKHYGLEEQILGPKGTMELEAGKMYTENPPPAPGILQLVNNIEHKVFDVIPLGGASWVPDNPTTEKGEYIINEDLDDDGTKMEMEGYAEAVKAGKIDNRLLKEAYYASIAALLGERAMDEKKVIKMPEEFIL